MPGAGDPSALGRLMPLLYDELSRQAHVALSVERGDHTLEPRALVHEVCLRLMDADVQWQDRAHFFALAAQTMRRILVDHARSRVSLDVVCAFDGPASTSWPCITPSIAWRNRTPARPS